MKPIDLFGKPFVPTWTNTSNRIFTDADHCYELVSFQGLEEHDSDALRGGLPSRIERCWIVNPDYDGDLPLEATGLPVVTSRSVRTSTKGTENIARGLHLLEVIKQVFRDGRDTPNPKSLSRFIEGEKAIRATLRNGSVLYLRDAFQRESPPDEAKAYWQSAQTKLDLEKTRAQLDKAETAAGLTLEEALKKWWNFHVPGMEIETISKIEKAVQLYRTDPQPSLEKIARTFSVSKPRVSQWFKQFKEATGFNPVIRHEPLRKQLANAEVYRRTESTPHLRHDLG